MVARTRANTKWFYWVDLRLLFVIITVGMTIAVEAGYQIGVWVAPGTPSTLQIGPVQGAIVGLFSLLLGFTYQVASARYDNRWQQVVEESNAIGTTFLRAQIFPEPHKSEISDLLREYTDVRIAFFDANTAEEIDKLLDDTYRIHDGLWSHAEELGKEQPGSIVVGLFINTLNALIDLHSTRVGFVRARVPETIMGTLILIGLISMVATGSVAGVLGHRLPILTTILAVIIGLVITMIFDLDRPAKGPTRVSEQSLLDLRDTIAPKDEAAAM